MSPEACGAVTELAAVPGLNPWGASVLLLSVCAVTELYVVFAVLVGLSRLRNRNGDLARIFPIVVLVVVV